MCAQLQQSRLELQEVRVSHRQLSARLAEMTEEKSLQGFSSNTHSLLCEIEQSMEQEELKQEKDQVCTHAHQNYIFRIYLHRKQTHMPFSHSISLQYLPMIQLSSFSVVASAAMGSLLPDSLYLLPAERK